VGKKNTEGRWRGEKKKEGKNPLGSGLLS